MKNKNKKALIASVIGLVLICMCFGAAGAGLAWLALRTVSNGFGGFPPDTDQPPSQSSAGDAKTNAPLSLNTQSPIEITRVPLNSTADADRDRIAQITNATMPREDLADLAVRFKGVSPKQAEVSCPTLSPGYEIGATRVFTLSSQDDHRIFKIQASLQYKTDHAYMWVESGPTRVQINQAKLRSAADVFENEIYPRTRVFFGSEASPGVDCDPHVYILHAIGIGRTVGGYFSSPDGYSHAVRDDSNEAQLFVMHASRGYNGSDPSSKTYMSTLAHEFQHMISFNQTHAPDLWLEEGAAQLSERLNGYADTVTSVYEFAAVPDTQLNTWEEGSAGGNGAHYGGGYLFWSYLYDRFGEGIVKKLARSPERSEQAFMRVLADNGIVNPDTNKPFTFEELFADFAIANYMNREKIEPAGNRYNYATIDVPPMATRANLKQTDYPFNVREAVPQFGTHYYEMEGNKPVTIDFTGSTIVPLLPTSDADGTFWWSNRADTSDPRLTREIDLTHVQSATLKYRAWYRLERYYDYAYASVSQDGGLTWALLKPTSCTTENPQSANLGCGYTGASGNSTTNNASVVSTPKWIDEQVSLNDYAGKKVLLRFETVTDAGVNREGLAIDNIEIPEIGFRDDANTDGDWQAEGWVRVDNQLPQHWQVQLITTGRDGKRSLQRVPLTDNSGTATLDFGGNTRTAVLAISPITEVTTEPGAYELQIR